MMGLGTDTATTAVEEGGMGTAMGRERTSTSI
jgi:hypothetical protein